MRIQSNPLLRFWMVIILWSMFPQSKVMAVVSDLGWGPTIKTGLDLYVATNGDDKNEGSINAPWQTIAKAQSFIRKLISGSALPDKGVTAWLRGGRYPLSSSLLFTSANQGTADKPIIYRACNNEVVSLFNGKMVDPSEWKPLNRSARNSYILIF